MLFIRNMIRAHRFFCHQSQHWVLGNWYEYEKRKYARRKEVRAFVRGFPRAYAKFMYWTAKDYFNGHRMPAPGPQRVYVVDLGGTPE